MTDSIVLVTKAPGIDLNEVMEQILALYPDHWPRLVFEDDTQWTIQKVWPEDPSVYADPRLAQNAQDCFSLGLADLAAYTSTSWVGDVPIVFCMVHSRALIAPALAWRVGGLRSPLPIIVHVDAHDDLMPVLLLRSDSMGLLSSTSMQSVNLDDVDSILEAVDDGKINKGNFLTAYLIGKPPGRLVHVCRGLESREYALRPRIETAVLGDAEISLTRLDGCEDGDGWTVQESSVLPLEIGEGSDSVWLDIDMDGFCNRYDGDSDRSEIPASVSELLSTRHSIEEFLGRLGCASWRSHIVSVSISASPGFFPSDMWKEMLPMVRDGVARILGGQDFDDG